MQLVVAENVYATITEAQASELVSDIISTDRFVTNDLKSANLIFDACVAQDVECTVVVNDESHVDHETIKSLLSLHKF